MPGAEQARLYEVNSSAQKMGETALWGAGVFTAELGVNDPLTHLEQYLEHGEAGIGSIDEDLITDCAERLAKPRFINSVGFKRSGNDFVSSFNNFSMRSMTATTEDKFGANVVDMEQYRRAQIERHEVERLNRWFETAQPDEAFIVESLPLNSHERYALARIYQKVNAQELAMHVITLHNSDINIFNQLRSGLGAPAKRSASALELLDNMYTHRPEASEGFDDFLRIYVNGYDHLLAARHPGQEFSFGLSAPGTEADDDMQKIRAQKPLRSVYLDTVRALGASGGYVTPRLAEIDQRLSLNLAMREGKTIPTDLAREMLDRSLQYIMATLNEASEAQLRELANSTSRAGVYAVAGGYGSVAMAAGMRYEGACPSSLSGAATAEAAALGLAYRSDKDPTKCVTCPECKKTVDLPKDLFKKGIYHCVECKTTYHKGKRINLGSKEGEPDILDRLSDHWDSIKQRTRFEQERTKLLEAERAARQQELAA